MKRNTCNNGKPQNITQITMTTTKLKYQTQEENIFVLEPPSP